MHPFADRLLGSWAVLPVSLAVVFGIATQFLLWQRKYLWAQAIAVGTVVLTLAGFALPHIRPSCRATLLKAAASPPATLAAFITILPFGVIILVPSLLFLYWTFRGEPNPEIPPGE
jgi:cytochrome d ubiquinol oxidase subunit II